MPSGLGGIAAAEAAFFGGFFTLNWTYDSVTYHNTNLIQQAPFTPSRTVYQYTLWEANDPLVHYLASDLNDYVPGKTGLRHSDDPASQPLPSSQVNIVGDRYQPWGRNDQLNGLNNVDKNAYNLAYRDPLIWGSDNWGFPTNKYPTVGWLGRVHRGTPWQTAYLKATNIWTYLDTTIPAYGTTTWTNWTGDASAFDAIASLPVQDHLLFDIFSTALNDNATRGQLSVNVGAPDGPSLAAWSAVFSGVVALTNMTVNPRPFTAVSNSWLVIDPAGALPCGDWPTASINGVPPSPTPMACRTRSSTSAMCWPRRN